MSSLCWFTLTTHMSSLGWFTPTTTHWAGLPQQLMSSLGWFTPTTHELTGLVYPDNSWAHWAGLSRQLMSSVSWFTPTTGERGGSVVECRTSEREVLGSRPTAAVLCPWARHFTPRKYWLLTQEAMAPSRHDWKIVDWDVKPQHNQQPTPTTHELTGLVYHDNSWAACFKWPKLIMVIILILTD